MLAFAESFILAAIEQEQQARPPNVNVANNVDIDVMTLTLSNTTLSDCATILNSRQGRRRNSV